MARKLSLYALLTLVGLVPFAAGSLSATPQTTSAASADWPTFGFDVARTSAPPGATGITAANVASLEKQQVTLDDFVDASAIYLKSVQAGGGTHDVFFVTTSFGKTVAINAADGAVLWTFTPPGQSAWLGSRQITNSTPAADPSRTFIYAASPDGFVQKLAVSDGHALWRTSITKLAQREKIASPLTFFRGRVMAVTAGYIGDAPPYQGHVAILDATSGALQHVWNALCSDRHELIDPASCPESGAAIWGRAGAIVDPATGEIVVATGDGKWDGKTYWGDATIHLDADATKILGNDTPSNTEELETRDIDVGSASPVWLGGGFIAQGGKNALVRLLTIDKMRGVDAHRGTEVQSLRSPSGQRIFTAAAVAKVGATSWLFVTDGGGTTVYTLASGQLQQAWQSATGGTSPVVAGGLLYVYDPAGSLRVFEPQTGKVVTTLEAGRGHWNSPIVADGRVLLPEGGGGRRGGGPAGGVINIWRLPARR